MRRYQNRSSSANILSALTSQMFSRGLLARAVSWLPRDLDSMLKVGTVVAITLCFSYGYLVNKTVSVTAEYSDLEQQLVQANNKLSSISSVVSAAELSLEENIALATMMASETEPSGFISRDTTSGFSYSSSGSTL